MHFSKFRLTTAALAAAAFLTTALPALALDLNTVFTGSGSNVPITTLSSDDTITARYYASGNKSGGIHLTSNARLTISGFTGQAPLTFQASANDILAFTADPGSSYLFSENTGASQGGAFVVWNAVTSFTNAIFAGNTASGKGGAIYSNSGTLTLTDSVFFGNIAATDGGVIHTYASVIKLNVSNEGISVIHDNTASDSSNFITLDGMGAKLNVTTESNGTLYMFDPARGYGDAITKAGAGTWKLAGTNAVEHASFTVVENGGTLHLYGSNETEGEITALGHSYTPTSIAAGVIELTYGGFTVGNNSTLELGGTGSGITTTSSTGVTFAAGSEVLFSIVSESAHGVIKTNNLTISGSTLRLDLSDDFIASAEVGTTLTLFVGTNSLAKLPTGEFASISDEQGLFEWEMDSTTGQIKIATVLPSTVPEPSTYALFGAVGAVALALLRRRKTAGK